MGDKYRRDRYRDELGLAIKNALRTSSARSHRNRVIILTASHHAGELTGNPRARMEWKQYYDRIIKKERIVLEGWPHDEIRFGEPSVLGTSELRRLVGLWRDGTMRLRCISQAEFEEIKADRDAKVARGEVVPTPPNKPRRDRGQLRIRTNPLTRGKKRRGLIKSKPYVESEGESEL